MSQYSMRPASAMITMIEPLSCSSRLHGTMKSISIPDGGINVGVKQPDSKSNLPDKLSETTVRGVVMTKIIIFLVFLLVLKGTIIFCTYLNGMATISCRGLGDFSKW